MTREPKEWIPLQLQKGRSTPAATIAIPGSFIQEALEQSKIEDIVLGEDELMVRRIAMKSKEHRGKIMLEIARASDVRRWEGR